MSVNVTVTGGASAGNLTFFPGDAYAIADVRALPDATAISFGAGQTRANNAVLLLAGSGTLAVHHAGVGPIHLIVDVNGYFF